MNALPDQPTPDRAHHTQVAAPSALSATSPAARRAALAFTEPDGPVVVVCGLHGGAGTSTLALLLAHYAAVAGSVPVLLCEAPGASGDQLALGAPESAASLDSLAVTLAIGARPPDGWWAERGTCGCSRPRQPPRFTHRPALSCAARFGPLPASTASRSLMAAASAITARARFSGAPRT